MGYSDDGPRLVARGRTGNALDPLAGEILGVIAGSERPLGADSVFFLLRDVGVNASAPTIGRRMRECESHGLLKKVSVEGRIITPAGLKALQGANRTRQLRAAGEALLNVLEKRGKDDLVELLVARRCLEREAARLAAENGNTDDIREMEDVLRDQQVRVEKAELGVDQDIKFHELIARASGNIFLETLISLLRRHGEYSQMITKIRSMSGNRLVVDHWAILEAIQRRDPAKTVEAVESHIDKLITEVANWRRKGPSMPTAEVARRTGTPSRKRVRAT